ncbi:hypothetical protein GY45DRAFT_1324666 [Cubamyces sp. BRFM 1775]|nr:hypothetical protein GY45DRAFT_1324666 [Cubamyces sp. BRFM 1775]
MCSVAFAIACACTALPLPPPLSLSLFSRRHPPLPFGLRIAFLSLSSRLPSPPPLSRPVRALLASSAGSARPPLPYGAPSHHTVVWQRHHLTFPTSPPPPLTITSALALKPLLCALSPSICIVLCSQPYIPRILLLWTTTSTLRAHPPRLCLLKTDAAQDARSRSWMRTEVLWSRSGEYIQSISFISRACPPEVESVCNLRSARSPIQLSLFLLQICSWS